MGYYTDYTISIINPDDVSPEQLTELEKEFKDIYEDGGFDYPFNAKWYGMSEDMLRISKAYSNVIFEIIGDGEEKGDHWRSYFLNSQNIYQRAKIVFPDVDLEQFKSVNFVPYVKLISKEDYVAAKALVDTYESQNK